MGKLQYLDKRDNRGVLLRYSAHELAYDVTQNAIKIIKSNQAYDLLVKSLPQKYLDQYYMKMIFEAFLPLAHQLVIYRHDKNKFMEMPTNGVNTYTFPCQFLLKKVWIDNNIEYYNSFTDRIKSNIKDKLNSLRIMKLSINRTLTSSIKPMGGGDNSYISNIAFNYVEGFERTKRSDLYWLEESGIEPRNVIVYYENKYMMQRHDTKKDAQEFFNKLGINQIFMWKWKPNLKNDYLKNLKLDLKLFNPKNEIEYWLKKSSITLYNKVAIWISFFYEKNIKIHLDPTESGLNTIIKQIAINQIGGVSIGKMRSYPTNLKGSFFGYYPNDVFFVWGSDSVNKMQKQSKIKNIIILGFPYNSSSKNEIEKRDITQQSKMQSSSPRFNILLFDSNHSLNKNLLQVVDSLTMKNFYMGFLDWVLDDKDVSMIIKPKKTEFLNKVPEIVEYINVVKKTGRLKLIDNAFQKMPSTYLTGIDIVVGVSTFMPTSVLECVIHGKRAVFYDYPNLSHHEPELYQWGENKVIFPDLNDMVSAVKAYKNDPSSNLHLGDWSEHLYELDPFLDGHGGRRIGTYMHKLQEGFKEGLNRDDTIACANRLYAEAWGEDKVNS